jgi:hypothetical protein
MASGLLNQVQVTSNAWTQIYGASPAGKTATINILACNISNTACKLYLTASNTAYASPPANSYLEFNTTLGATDVFERGGIVLGAGSFVYFRTEAGGTYPTINVAVTVTGYEV